MSQTSVTTLWVLLMWDFNRWCLKNKLSWNCAAGHFSTRCVGRVRQIGVVNPRFPQSTLAAILRVSNDSPKTMQDPDRGNDLTMPQTFSRVAQDPYLTVTGVVLGGVADPVFGRGLEAKPIPRWHAKGLGIKLPRESWGRPASVAVTGSIISSLFSNQKNCFKECLVSVVL